MARRPALSDTGVTRPSLAVITPDRLLPTSHESRPPARKGKRCAWSPLLTRPHGCSCARLH